MTRHRFRSAALLLALAMVFLSAVDATAAGPKRIFITKTDENFQGQAGVTFELYEDTDGDGVRDDGEPKLQTKVTDAAGSATFDPVNPGKYIVHEVTPAGYVDNPDQAVEIPNAKGKGPTIVFSNTPTPSHSRVNDPTGDTALDDGTHVFDFGPSIGVAPNGEVLIAWNDTTGFHSPGDVSGTGTAVAPGAGQPFEQTGKLPTGTDSAFILAEPSVVFDQITNQWVVASDAFVATANGVTAPILVNRSGGPFGFWRNAVNATPGLDPLPEVAHGPNLDIDPVGGLIYLSFILSNDDGTSQPMVSTSADGGATWSTPVPVTDPGTFDFVDSAVGSNGNLNLVFSDYGGPAATSFDLVISRSTDGGLTFSSLTPIVIDQPKPGTPGTCTDSMQRSFLGGIFASEQPQIAANPARPNTLFVAYAAHGQGMDEGDILVSRSTDGGRTWSPTRPVGETENVQFNPSMDVTPDGRIGVATYEALAGDPAYGGAVSFLSAFGPLFGFDPRQAALPVIGLGDSPLFQTDPSFDSDIANCHGLESPSILAPGSGFLMAWTDGRDPGPAGNNGVDPNIYFAHTEGPLLATELDASVDRTATKVKVSGEVVPQPLPGARVTVTLFQDDGGGFDQIARKRPRTGNGGDWETSFGRPSGGRCQVVVEFGGAEGRQPSVPVTKTFAC